MVENAAQTATAELISLGCDWITATVANATLREQARELAHALARECQQAGFKQSPAGGHGYAGWRVGPVTWAERNEDALFQITGAPAARSWQHVAGLSTNVSRLDVQATVRFTPNRPKLAQDAYTAWQRASHIRGRPVKGSLTVSDPSGETAYFGAPQSHRRARIYDKYAESGEEQYERCWRYEVQLRDKAARSLSLRLASSARGDGAVGDFLRQHFSSVGFACPGLGSGDLLHAPVPRTASDFDRRSRWLSEQVAPVAREVARRGGWPFRAQAPGLPGGPS